MILETNFEVLDNNFYICFVDTNYKLSKITSEELLVSSFESVIRKFYIVSNTFHNYIIYSDVFISGYNIEEYEVKSILNKKETIHTDFISSSNSFFFNSVNPPLYTNAIPLDILLTSYSNKNITTTLNIKVDFKKILDIA